MAMKKHKKSVIYQAKSRSNGRSAVARSRGKSIETKKWARNFIKKYRPALEALTRQ